MMKTKKNVVAEAPKKEKKKSLLRYTWKRLCRNKMAIVAMILIVLIVFSAVFSEYLTPYSYSKQNGKEVLKFPSAKHPFGTDNFGRDLLTRVLKGGQISLLVSLLATLLAAGIGTVLGATAAYFGGVYAAIVMRLMDIIMSIPAMLFAILISAVLGSGIMNTVIACALPGITQFCRIAYAQVLKETNNEYVAAATICGAKPLRKIFGHLLPNSLAPLIIQISLRLGNTIMMISGLSFIGLGVQPPTPEWGSIIAGARQYIRTFWPIVTFPGIMIALTVISFNIFGDGLRDALDPRQK